MTGPHPVIGLTAKLSGRFGGSAYKTHVTIYLVYYDIFLVAVVKVGHLYLTIGILFPYTVQQGIGLILFHAGNIDHALKEGYRQAGNGYFLVLTHSPKTVFKIVVLGT